MKWFVAKIIFRIVNEDAAIAQFDEHIRLISADNADEAYLKARVIGITEEDSFLNANRRTVKWEFINVSELHAIDGLSDGAEIYSKIHETKDEEEYVQQIHQRAILIRTKSIASTNEVAV
jgi:hypothetical protein